MNFKIFIRIIILLVTIFILVGGVVIGGVALSYRIVTQNNKDTPVIPDSQQLENIQQDKKEETEVLNFLVLGVDNDGYRTDVTALAQYNFDTEKVNVVQIPRDTKIETKRYDKKINSAYAFGKEDELFEAVDKLLGVSVDRYVLVNIQGFRNLIDEIGGVKINVPIRMLYDDPIQNLHINLKKGEQVLNGRKAEMFVRFRKNNDGTGYPDGDIGRVKAQQEFIDAAIDQVFSMKNVLKVPKLVAIILKNVKTNFEMKEIMQYIDKALNVDKNNINMMLLPGQDSYIGGVSYYIHDKKETEKMVQQYFMGYEYEESIEEDSVGNNKLDGE